MKSKKGLIIWSSIIAVALLALHLILSNACNLLPASRSEPESIMINYYSYDGAYSGCSLSVCDEEAVDTICSLLKSVDTKAVLFPDELSAWVLDTEYELILKYDNQKEAIIFTGTETPDTFYRYSGTTGSTGEKGYIRGKSAELHQLIAALFENRQKIISDSDITVN